MAKKAAVRESVQRYRDRMRHAGFRLVQMWVPDTRADGFARECQRQSRVANRHKRHEKQIMDWVEKNEDTTGWQP